MARAVKETTVAELTERFQNSSGAVLTEYRGLTVAQVKELRLSLGEHATFSVVKNTLTKIAAKDAGVAADFTELLAGPSAIAFVGGDVVQAAKGLRDFAKTNPLLVIKGGVLDGKILTPSEISKLADLESREVLLAKLAGAMKASLAGAAGTFAALPVQMARLLAALEEKRAKEARADAPRAEVDLPGSAADDASAAAQVADAVPDVVEDAVPVTDAVPDVVEDAVPATDAVPDTVEDAVPVQDAVPVADAVPDTVEDAVPVQDAAPDDSVAAEDT
jgi:large subunit ribosomal protein L10